MNGRRLPGARRWLRMLIAGWVCCWCSASVFAQQPQMAEESDGWDRGWGLWFAADAVYFNRENSAHSIPVIEGPEKFRLGDNDFGWKPGTRLSIGAVNDDYEFVVSYLNINSWNSGQSGLLTHGLDFDGPVAYGSAALGQQAIVDIGSMPNFLTSSTLFAPINTAANASGETDALEFLQAGARFDTRYTSNFQDLEVNYSQRQQPGRWLRFGLGYRHAQLRETGFASLAGTFGSADLDGVGSPTNAGLSDGSLTGSGLTLTSASATNNGFSDAIAAAVGPPAVAASPADQLLFTSSTLTNNRLDGIQAIADLSLFQSDYLDLSAFAKAGVYHNLASGAIKERYADTLNDKSTYARNFMADRHALSFLGHSGATARLYVRHNIRLTAGYEVLFLTGLALAPDQLRDVSSPVTGAAFLNLQTDGTMFIHGGRVGLEITFP